MDEKKEGCGMALYRADDIFCFGKLGGCSCGQKAGRKPWTVARGGDNPV